MSAGYRPIIWYNLVDTPSYPGYGLLDVNRKPKPSYYAVSTYASELGSAQPVPGRYFGDGFESYRFATPSGNFTEVVWTTTGVTTTVSLPCPTALEVDKWGTPTFVMDGFPTDADGKADGHASVRVPPSPVYLQLCPTGDLNCSGTVQSDDVQTLAQESGLRRGDPEYEAGHDLNGDGRIDREDVIIAATHEGEVCTWP
jgi:hypothetical protein